MARAYRLWGLVFGVAAGLPSVVAAQAWQPKKQVTAVGLGDFAHGNKAKAREDAIANARKNALEQTVGVHIKSMMSDEAHSVVRDQKEKFEQRVTSKVYQQAEGYLGAYTVLGEKAVDMTYEITISIEVNDVQLQRQLALLAREIAGARFPKIMFVVEEKVVDRSAKAVAATHPTLQALLENALLARGFELVAQEAIEQLRGEEREVFANEAKAAAVAMRYKAEYIITAVATVKETSFNDLRMNEYHGFVELNLKGINASSAQIVASVQNTGQTPANCYSLDELRVRGVTQVSPKLIDELLNGILRTWDAEATRGARYLIKVENMPDEHDERLVLMEQLEGIDEVKNVKQISWGGGRLEVELFYPLAKDVSELERAIYKKTKRNPDKEVQKLFAALRTTFLRGRDLYFEFKPKPKGR